MGFLDLLYRVRLFVSSFRRMIKKVYFRIVLNKGWLLCFRYAGFMIDNESRVGNVGK